MVVVGWSGWKRRRKVVLVLVEVVEVVIGSMVVRSIK